jgi:hypothetical protein
VRWVSPRLYVIGNVVLSIAALFAGLALSRSLAA